jgi:hypothetical protein
MANNYETTSVKGIRELTGEARAQELLHLKDMVARPDPITLVTLSDFISASDNRKALLAGSVWGGIRWPKSLGRPKTPSITAGFNIVHEFKVIDYEDLGGGSYQDTSTFRTQPAPSFWDASSASEYRVAFFFFAGGGGINPNRLIVSLASVHWDINPHIRAGRLRLDPYGYSDFGNLGERVVFPDFVVQHVPYISGRSIQPLGPAKDSELYKQPVP